MFLNDYKYYLAIRVLVIINKKSDPLLNRCQYYQSCYTKPSIINTSHYINFLISIYYNEAFNIITKSQYEIENGSFVSSFKIQLYSKLKLSEKLRAEIFKSKLTNKCVSNMKLNFINRDFLHSIIRFINKFYK